MQTQHLATQKERSFLRKLQHQFPIALGFLPDQALEQLIDANACYVRRQDGQLAGFILVRPFLATSPTICSILQTAVEMDAQRRHHALNLLRQIEADALKRRISVIKCWCREELQANDFWQAAGFSCRARRPAGRSQGGNVLLWAKLIQPIELDALLFQRADRPRSPGGSVTRAQLPPTIFDQFYNPVTRRISLQNVA